MSGLLKKSAKIDKNTNAIQNTIFQGWTPMHWVFGFTASFVGVIGRVFFTTALSYITPTQVLHWNIGSLQLRCYISPKEPNLYTIAN